jgi:tetratricopeptide (TPR) repeat protein
VVLALLLGLGPTAQAQAPADTSALARHWDHINFEITDRAAAEAEADVLERDAAELARAQPNDPGPLIWEAAALLAKADARHDLSSLGLAKRARALLEKAAQLGASGDEGGFAFAMLGTLYADTPGFPLGFGDHKKARVWFAKARAAAPDNIDVNVLYGDFLLHQRNYAGAIAAYKHALDAPAQPGREIDDRYRRQEATTHMAKAEKREGGQ